MRNHPRGHTRLPLVPALLAVGACAPAALPDGPSPAQIPALEAAVDRFPDDVAARTRLGEAYRRAGRAEAALSLLEPASRIGYAPATVLLGLAYEDLGRLDDARALYRAYLESPGGGSLSAQVRSRLAVLRRAELEGAVRSAIANERGLAGRVPSPATIGVFPFLTVTEDPELRPLGTALAELITTDLAQTDRLQVLERTRLQHLLDEIALAESGRVDPSTAARTGRLLGAGRIVQGRAEGARESLSLEAVVVPVASTDSIPEGVRDAAAIDEIFELEKRLALSLYQAMGIQLTPAERERVTRRQTENVQALIAFGFGLEAMDAGRYAEAVEQFRRAVQLDPAFELGEERLTEAEALALAIAPAELDRLAAGELGSPYLDWQGLRLLFAPLDALVPDPSGRESVVEALGTEGVDRSGTAEIIIRPPGGTP